MSVEIAENSDFNPKKGRILRVGLSALAVVGALGAGQLAMKSLWEPGLVMSTRPLQTLAQLELRAETRGTFAAEDVVVPELAGYQERSIRSLAPARAPRIAAKQRAVVASRRVVDTFQERAAAPRRLMPFAQSDTQANAQERAALADVYRNLKRQFLVSLVSDQLPAELTTQTLLASLDPIPAPARQPKRIAKPAPARSTPVVEESVAVAQAPIVQEESLPVFDAAPVTTQMAQAPEITKIQVDSQERVALTPSPATPEKLMAEARVEVETPLTQSAPVALPKPSEESLAQMSEKLATLPRIASAKPAAVVAQAAPAPAQVTPAKSDYSSEKGRTDDQVTQNGLVPSVTTQFTEFFDPQVIIDDAYPTPLTRDHRDRGWNIAASATGYPSLYWVSGADAGAPILSKNSAEILARSAGISMSEGTSIVMGRVPRGFRVDFASRTARVLYINDQRQISEEIDVRSERDFILFNAKPGFEIISFASAELGQGGVAVPLLTGHATYVDLRHIDRTVVSGKVVLATSPARAISGVQVQVVGQQSAVAISGQGGAFQISRVLAVRGMDLFVETLLEDGFTFRHSVGSDETQRLELYRLPDADIQAWIDQLEGGVSEQSGLVMAAMPRLMSKAKTAAMPMLQTLAADPVLAPEIYGLTPEGQLVPQGQLDVVSSRALGAQIPEGPARLSFEAGAEKGTLEWSTLIPASPRVIQLVSY